MTSELEEVIKEMLTALKIIMYDLLLSEKQGLHNIILAGMNENLCNHPEETLQH